MSPDAAPRILAIDAGTSALKAVLYSLKGQPLATAAQRYGYRTPRPGWAEADPDAWWRALEAALAQLRSQGHDLTEVQALGLTGQMHTPVLLDEQGEVIPPVILWLDQRAGAELRELQTRLHLPPYQLNASFSLPKLLWLRRHHADALARARTLLWPKDYLRFRLTGRRLTDETDAAGGALLDWDRRVWATDRLSLVDIDPAILPEIRPADADAGPLRPGMAQQLGLSPRARIIVGAGDVISLIGVAPLSPGRLICSLGSSIMLALPANGVTPDSPHSLHLYPFLHRPLLNGIQSTSGAALTWAWRALFSQQSSLEQTIVTALQTPPAAEGLIFLPYLAGERNPYWNDALRGAFFGLSLAHRRDHMLRAVMEGVAFSMRHLIDIAESLGANVTEIALAGGGARISGWPQIIADICQRPVFIFSNEEVATRSLFAYVRQALTPQLDFDNALAAAFSPPLAAFQPDLRLKQLYDKSYTRFIQLSDFLHTISS